MDNRPRPTIAVDEIIALLGLERHVVEGGYFAETYRSTELLSESCLPARFDTPRPVSTAIYYLLTNDTRSEMHRLTSDEVYHFYLGDPVTMLNLHPGASSDIVTLGCDIAARQKLQHVVPHGAWQGACLREGGRFALLGTTVAPGFDYADYESGARTELTELYPDMGDLIARLTDAPD